MAAGEETPELVTMEQIQTAYTVVQSSPFCVRTPLLKQVEGRFYEHPKLSLYLKLENHQITGSFKVKGIANQLKHLPADVRDGKRDLVTMSAGNYGKAFAYTSRELGYKAHVMAPKAAPSDRITIMEGYGATVETYPTADLVAAVDDHVREHGMYYLHSFDDLNIIAGHASIGLEILEDLPDPDVIAVCCGGGGLVSGIAAAVKLSGRKETRIYCVEPETANSMDLSFKAGKAVKEGNFHSIATGLSPPCAGEHTYNHCKHFTEGVLLVSDEEIVSAVRYLYERGLLVEASGAAAFAALMSNKIPDVEGKKVVIVLTGSNVSPQDMNNLLNEDKKLK